MTQPIHPPFGTCEDESGAARNANGTEIAALSGGPP